MNKIQEIMRRRHNRKRGDEKMEIDEIKKELLNDENFMRAIYDYINKKSREDFDKAIKMSLAEETTNDKLIKN